MENLEMKTSEFSQRPFDQTPRFSISEFSVWGIAQNGKLGVEKPRKNILHGFRVFRVFDLIIFRLNSESNFLGT